MFSSEIDEPPVIVEGQSARKKIHKSNQVEPSHSSDSLSASLLEQSAEEKTQHSPAVQVSASKETQSAIRKEKSNITLEPPTSNETLSSMRQEQSSNPTMELNSDNQTQEQSTDTTLVVTSTAADNEDEIHSPSPLSLPPAADELSAEERTKSSSLLEGSSFAEEQTTTTTFSTAPSVGKSPPVTNTDAPPPGPTVTSELSADLFIPVTGSADVPSSTTESAGVPVSGSADDQLQSNNLSADLVSGSGYQTKEDGSYATNDSRPLPDSSLPTPAGENRFFFQSPQQCFLSRHLGS
jgi:hypothetical protein